MNTRSNGFGGKGLLMLGLLGAAAQPGIAGQPGMLTREIWNNVPGSKIADFTGSARYWQTANSVSTFAGSTAPSNASNVFASRVRGYITAPVTGNYTFWIASDDASELRLSTNDSKFNRVKIASVSGWVGAQAWDTQTSQKSALIHLEAGQRYFVEALHIDAGGADHLAIAWQVPGGQRELIPASALESFTVEANDVDNDELPDDWETAAGFSLTDNGTTNPNQHPLADPDHDGYSNLEEAEYGTAPLARGGIPGSLLLETWTAIGGVNVKDLTWNTKFSATPNSSEFVFSAETPVNRAENYGARMRGYVIAPTTGEYTFYIAGDDDCELWLSTSDSQFAKAKIASVIGYTSAKQWTKFASQKSVKISLAAGQKYYIEALVKEGAGGDHLEIGWQKPGTTSVEVIPGSALESYAYDAADADGDNMPSEWEELHGLDVAVNDAAADPDKDGIPNWLEFANSSNPQTANSISGGLVHELWKGIPGFLLRDLRDSPKFLQEPDVRNLVTKAEGPADIGDLYGNRLRGYLTAPVTGAYTFWALGDDETEFWLSTSDSKFGKQLLIHPTIVSRSFDADLSQKSRTVNLVAGQRYYLEIIHKADYSSDFVSVAWQKPGGAREVIPGSVLSTFVPTQDDKDDDDLPDAWESLNGLSQTDNGKTNSLNGANGDLDGDGLSNAAEFKAGTRADVVDTDGDGVNDCDEVKVLETQALVADAAPFEMVADIEGASFMAASGEWVQEDGKAMQVSARGSLDYQVNLNADGVYQIDCEFTPSADANISPDYEIVFSVDGNTPQRVTASSANGDSTHAKVLSPWLRSGTHTIRVFVDNSYRLRRVSVDRLQLLAARGVDANSNNTPDWVEAQLARRNSIEAPSHSKTSPVCLEGASRWPELAMVAGTTPKVAINDRWYADVALSAEIPTLIDANLENGAIQTQRTVEWIPTNLLTEENITIREGDSLLLTAYTGEEGTAAESVQITCSGESYSTSADVPIESVFQHAGVFTVQVTHISEGNVTQRSVNVTVVSAPQVESPVCVVGSPREIDIPALANGITFELDERIKERALLPLSGGGNRFTLVLNDLNDRNGVYRNGSNGPVIGVLPIRAMRLRDGDKTGIYFSENLGDDSYAVDMPVIVDGVYPGVSIRYDIFISGTTFEDGSIQKNLQMPQDLNLDSDYANSGSLVLRFLKAGTNGSNCRRVSVWQEGQRISYSE